MTSILRKTLQGGTNSGWREWGRHVNWRCGNFLPENLIYQLALKKFNPGYTTHYMFPEKVGREARKLQSSKGLAKTVGGYYLIMDFDDGVTQIPATEKELQKLGIGYDLFQSGGKGFHFYLYHDLLWSPYLPYSQKHWVLNNLSVEPDLSLYQTTRLVALPGRVHRETKLRKVLIKSVPGKTLALSIIQPPEKELRVFKRKEQKEQLIQGLLRCITLLHAAPKIGNRHTALWGTSKDLLQGGLHPKAVHDLLSQINNYWEKNKDDKEVIKAIEQAIKSNSS